MKASLPDRRKDKGLEQELAELAMPLGEAEKAMQDRMCELSKRRPELELSAGRLREAMPSLCTSG